MSGSIRELSQKELAAAKRSAAIRLEGDVIRITPSDLRKLKRLAAENPLQRARFCLHPGDESPVQQMIIAATARCYMRPHRHRNKPESFCILEGELDVIFLDDSGCEVERLEMGATGSGKIPVYRLASNYWHTVIARTDIVVFCETTVGPFDRRDTDYPQWAPGDADIAGAAEFMAGLLRNV